MKTLVILLCLMFPVVAVAQDKGMDTGNMQQMMQLMQKMQQCMQKIDQSKLEALGEQSEKISNELDALCKKGERKKAQKKAIAYSKKMMKDPVVLQVKKCGEITKGLVPAELSPSIEDEFDFSDKHVCDDR